jgi:uncharacterized membrane protein
VQGKRGIFPDIDDASMAESEATPSLDEILERTIRSLVARRREDEAAGTQHMQFAGAITSFAGSMSFVYAHLLVFGVWIFVLIIQNRMAATADQRDELALQIGLLTEHELTKLIPVVAAMAKRMGVTTEADEELAELKQDVTANEVLDKIESVDIESRAKASATESEPVR